MVVEHEQAIGSVAESAGIAPARFSSCTSGGARVNEVGRAAVPVRRAPPSQGPGQSGSRQWQPVTDRLLREATRRMPCQPWVESPKDARWLWHRLDPAMAQVLVQARYCRMNGFGRCDGQARTVMQFFGLSN